jgi:tRNA(Arg) A34 adenosine deaminase TadA
MESTGESHAIIRAIMNAQIEAKNCDVYVSRFPCATCTKMMVQSGINRVYYFPAQYWEMDWGNHIHTPVNSILNSRILKLQVQSQVPMINLILRLLLVTI